MYVHTYYIHVLFYQNSEGGSFYFRCIEVRALDRKLLLQSIPDVKDTKYHASGKYVRLVFE